MIYLKLVLTMVFWGGTFIAARYVSYHIGPFSGAFLRFLIASFFFFPITFKQRKQILSIPTSIWIMLIFLGMSGIFAYNYFFFKGLNTVEAGRAAVIIATNPIFISLFAVILFKEPMSKINIVGILISVLGAMVVISKGDLGAILSEGIGHGEMLILGCVFSWVVYSILGKYVMKEISPVSAISISTYIGTTALFIPAFNEGLFEYLPSLNSLDWISLAYLGVFGTVLGFFWFYEGMNEIGAARASIFINLVPISAIIIAYFLLNETISVPIFLGIVLVILGVYLTNRKLQHDKQSDWMKKINRNIHLHKN
ncbi:MAG: DMT family transporter [Calditrichia bacterium]